MLRSFSRRRGSAALTLLRALGASAALVVAASCHEGIDTTRKPLEKATLGDDIFGVLCDRVAAAALTEDLTGASFHDVCHYTKNGEYADHVATKVLPPVKGEKAERARALSIAKVEAMARRRSDLIRAFNAIFPDVDIDDPTTEAQGDTVNMHDALMSLGQTLSPLYEQNPYDSNGAPLLPTSTQSLGRLFDALATSKAARQALERITTRQGYRPFPVALGAIRAALAYPNMRELALASLAVLGPKGDAVPELQQLLTVSKRELLTSKPVVAPLPSVVVDAATGQPNRPRTNIEVARAMMLDEHPSFARNDDDPQRFIVLRDRRGFAIPTGSTPGVPGAVPAPFVDADGDGYADVDGFGRFLDGSGAPLSVDTPFAIPGIAPIAVLDDFGRPSGDDGKPLWQYLDTSRTLTGSMARHLVPLLDATQTSDAGNPDSWKNEHEAMMYLMGGAYQLYGDREDAVYDHANEIILRPDEPCTGDATLGAVACAKYSRFRGEDSPLPKLVHAAGQVLADPESDAVLLGMIDLLENHEQVVARVVGAALEVKAIADAHDEAARQGKEPFASMAYEIPIWDEMGAILGQITDHPGLVTKLLAAIGDDAVVTPYGGSEHLGQTLSSFVHFKDQLQYDTNNLNGPAVNLTVGSPSTADPETPVDWTVPQTGANRSLFQRSIQAIADASGIRACNKQGAQVYTNFLGFDFHFGNYSECDLFQIDNLGGLYLGSILPANHPKRAKMNIKPSELNTLLGIVGSNNADGLFEDSSQITGMTLHPTSQALNRLVLFGASSDEYSMPDLDPNIGGANAQSNEFIRSLIEPVAPIVCDKKGNGVHHCGDTGDLLRIRDVATLFAWERLGFYDYLRPTLQAFAEVSCTDSGTCDTNDYTGENMFLGLISTLSKHWPGPEHGAECVKTVKPDNNARYCSEAGGNRYEPILTDAFMSDLIPAIHELAQSVTELSTITVARGPKAGQTMTGAEVLEQVTKILFDPKYAAAQGIVDRNGNASSTWTDGTPQPQVTVFGLFADALHDMDVRFDQVCGCEGQVADALAQCREGCEVRGQWKRARSQMVDEFLAVEGTGDAARFKNRGMARTTLTMLRVLREQLNANCPDREQGQPCQWAKRDLGDKMASTISGPVFAAMMDVQEKIRLDDNARRELERFLSYILEAASDDDSLQGTLASVSDLLQILADDDVMSAIFNAVATAANPAGDGEGPGCADTTIKVFKALKSDKYDKYHVLDVAMPLVVTPMDKGQGPTPLEIFIDTVAEVNRIDADATEPLTNEDYKAVMGSVRDFFTDERRGLEQFYYIVQRRPRE